MILFPCTSCCVVIRVMGDPEEISQLIGRESDLYPNSYRCPVCEHPVELQDESEVSPDALVQSRLRDLTAQEFFQSQCGLGLPEERACTRKVIDVLFQQGVKKVHGKEVPGSGRFHVEFLGFMDGTRAYFGASSFGSLIYRIRPPHSHVETLNEH